MSIASAIAARWQARWGKRASRALRWAVTITLLAILGVGLARIGWREVWEGRPRAVGFYLILLPPYLVQPVADLIIYRSLLGVGRALPLSVLLRKRYLNGVMLEYSGEAYLFFWARRNLGVKHSMLLHAVKDSNVLSAGAGLTMVWLILLALVAKGGFAMPAFMAARLWAFVSIGSLPLILCLVLVVGGRRVTALSRREVVSTFAIHLGRSVVGLGLEFAAWWLSGALPSATICLEFVGLRLLLTRLPLVPSKDLLFVGLGIAAAGALDLSAPRVAAVLVLLTASQQILDFIVVGLPWFVEQFQAERRADHASS